VRILLVSSIAIVCAAAAAACSSSDEASSGPKPDAGVTPPNPPPDPPPPPGNDAGPDLFTADEIAAYKLQSPLPAVPADPTNAFADSAAAAVLGQRLFFDKSYSGALAVADDGANGGLGAVGDTGKVSCASCHASLGTDDNRSKPNNVSLGTDFGTRNALPIVNSSFYKWTNWAGRFDSQWSLPLAVAENAKIMKSTRLSIAHMLWNKYKADYDAIFPVPLDAALDPAAADAARFPASGKPKAAPGDPDGAWEGMAPADQAIVNRIFANYGKAIAAYVRLVVSRNAPFDKFVAGDANAIDLSAKRGLKVFLGKGKCASCHAGPDFTDNDFHDIGVPQTGPHVPATDLGRFTDVAGLLASPFNTNGTYSDNTSTGKLTNVAQTADLTGRFRTKGLRGLSTSAPYMHSGQFATLPEVVDFYDKGGGDPPDGGAKDPKLSALGLSAEDKTDLVAFLKSLDGDPVPMTLVTDTSR
jgi:cytochrome c peroxidase